MDQYTQAHLPVAGTGTKPMYKHPNSRSPLPLSINQGIQLLPTHHHLFNSDSLVENQPNHKIITTIKQVHPHSVFMLQNKPFDFSIWAQKGITHLHHLFENNHFMSFNAFTQTYGVGREQFLQYQQLRLKIKDNSGLTDNTLQPSQLTEELMKIIKN